MSRDFRNVAFQLLQVIAPYGLEQLGGICPQEVLSLKSPLNQTPSAAVSILKRLGKMVPAEEPHTLPLWVVQEFGILQVFEDEMQQVLLEQRFLQKQMRLFLKTLPKPPSPGVLNQLDEVFSEVPLSQQEALFCFFDDICPLGVRYLVEHPELPPALQSGLMDLCRWGGRDITILQTHCQRLVTDIGALREGVYQDTVCRLVENFGGGPFTDPGALVLKSQRVMRKVLDSLSPMPVKRSWANPKKSQAVYDFCLGELLAHKQRGLTLDGLVDAYTKIHGKVKLGTFVSRLQKMQKAGWVIQQERVGIVYYQSTQKLHDFVVQEKKFPKEPGSGGWEYDRQWVFCGSELGRLGSVSRIELDLSYVEEYFDGDPLVLGPQGLSRILSSLVKEGLAQTTGRKRGTLYQPTAQLIRDLETGVFEQKRRPSGRRSGQFTKAQIIPQAYLEMLERLWLHFGGFPQLTTVMGETGGPQVTTKTVNRWVREGRRCPHLALLMEWVIKTAQGLGWDTSHLEKP